MRIANKFKKVTIAGTAVLASAFLLVGCSPSIPDPNDGGGGGIENPVQNSPEEPNLPNIPGGNSSPSDVDGACAWLLDEMDKASENVIELDTDGRNLGDYVASLDSLVQGYHSIINRLQNPDLKSAVTELTTGWEHMVKYLSVAATGNYGDVTADMTEGMELFAKGNQKIYEICGMFLPSPEY